MTAVLGFSSIHRSSIQFSASCLTDTRRLGGMLARLLKPADVVCFHGPLGAGKSELCRAIIRQYAGNQHLEVPSPSYTLVNVYEETGIPIWHADLYRIGDESELIELGLYDALDVAIVLIEWPDRWADLPARRLEIDIQPFGDDARAITLTSYGAGWEDLMERVGTLT